jgi:glycosyltransferase involved in cell wall biosynthesis
MKLLVAIDQHYVSNGRHIYSAEGTAPYTFLQRAYLRVFEQVIVVGRLRWDEHFDGQPEAMVDGPNVEFFSLPEFRGPFQYALVRNRVLARIREVIPKADAYLLRGPGIIGRPFASELERRARHYAVQVLGDPWTIYGKGHVGGFLRPFYRQVLTRKLKRICRNAAAVSYVTRLSLQRRYPASPGAFVTSWSDVQIKGAIATDLELEQRLGSLSNLANRPAVLGFIGTLEVPYKGADILLRAVAACRAQGVKVVAHLVGTGKLLSKYQHLSERLGIADHIIFLGQLRTGGPIFQFLDSVDLFVMPSLVEGLPRALIEAMARGCPCIGTNVGGIPELLEPADLVEPGDSAALARQIKRKLASSAELYGTARRNRTVAKAYQPQYTQAAEFAFLHAIRNQAIAGTKGALAKHAASRTDYARTDNSLHRAES